MLLIFADAAPPLMMLTLMPPISYLTGD